MDEGFHYSTMPNARGGCTSRIALGKQITEAELDSAVSGQAGLPPEKCAEVFTLYLREMLAQAGKTRWSPGLYDLITLTPKAGGSKQQAEDFRTAQDINAGVSLSFAAGVVREWQKTLSLVSAGRRGLVTPVLAGIICCSTDRPDEYVSGGLVTVRGRHLKIDPDNPGHGVVLILEDGTELHCDTYGTITRLQLTVLVPDTVTGPIRVRVTNEINGSLRSTTYPVTLRQVAAPVIH